MLTRRDFMQLAAATATMVGSASLGRAVAGQKITQDDLLKFDAKGQVTLLNFTDMHAQLKPLYFREPSINLGVGDNIGVPPHITGQAFLKHFGIQPGTSAAYALTSEDFVALANNYGRVGGLDRMATLIKAIRAERPNNTILLDGGDTWQGSYTSLMTKGEDMVRAMNALGVDGMTAHWEFTYGTDRVQELVDKLDFPFLCQNVRDTNWEEEVFETHAFYERSGVKVGVIGQAYPYTPIANPRYMIPEWGFGIQEKLMRDRVQQVRDEGADLVVVVSHNGFDIDKKMASRVDGIDVILTGHTHDAIPDVVKVNDTLLVASGSHGKFLARLDLDVQNKKIKDYSFKLIPVFSDVITPDPEMRQIIGDIRAPHKAQVKEVLGTTESLLYRRGNFNGTFDDLICQAIVEEMDAQISLSPGFRWGATLIPGQDITVDDVYTQTAITYPNVYRTEFSGEYLKTILEDVADNLFHPDPYYQQGGDMVRAGNLAYTIDVNKPIGQRISNMSLVSTGETIDAGKNYVVSGWASVNDVVEGPAIYDVVTSHIRKKKVVRLEENRNVTVRGA